MAVVEIAKIQIRRGDARTDGMPQLDTGELGWAISGTQPYSTTPELFIGNNTDTTGVPVTENIRILTTYDLPNIFGSSITTSTYYYSGHRSVDIFTGSGDSNLTRTVEEKLNDQVSLFDFMDESAYLDDSYDYTSVIQRAINQLFLNDDKNSPRARTALKIPAGVYSVSSTLYVPAYASIIGDGKDKTILSMSAVGTPLMQFVDLTSNDGLPVVLGDLVSGTSPRNIVVSGLTLTYQSDVVPPDSSSPLLLADGCIDSIIQDVKFLGSSPYASSNNDHTGIEIRGQSGITSKNLRITNCVFESLFYGIKSDYNVEGTLIDSNRFEDLSRGIVYFEDPQAVEGPTKSRITRNTFDVIAREAVRVDGTSTQFTNHILSDNIFTNVGNNSSLSSPGLGDIGDQAYSVVHLATSGNVSDYDTFSRFTEINNVNDSVVFVPPVYGHVSLVDNRVLVKNLDAVTSTGTLVKVAKTDQTTNIRVQYQITSAGISRWGDLTLVCSANTLIVDDPNLPIIPVTDTYSYFGANDTGIVFEGRYDSMLNTIYLVYTGNGVTGTITYQINQYY